jgi:hypothetical protein
LWSTVSDLETIEVRWDKVRINQHIQNPVINAIPDMYTGYHKGTHRAAHKWARCIREVSAEGLRLLGDTKELTVTFR